MVNFRDCMSCLVLIIGLTNRYNLCEASCVCLKSVFNATSQPVSLVQDKDGRRVYLAEQRGVVYSFAPDWSGRSVLADISDKVVYVAKPQKGFDERGLLGFALHPNFTNGRGRFYMYSVRKHGDDQFSYVTEMERTETGVEAEKTLLVIPQRHETRNGGQLFFGNDGYLYIAVGDGGVVGDADASATMAQDGSTLLGKILRIDVNGRRYDSDSNNFKEYDIPDDNPFTATNDSFKPEIYAYGFRNPWRCSVDSGNGDIYCGDLGSRFQEEIDMIQKGGNYGWNFREGTHCNVADCKDKNDILPIYSYDYGKGAAVIGGYVYRGKAIKYLTGKYVYADTLRRTMHTLTKADQTWTSSVLELCPQTKCPCGAREKHDYILSFAQDAQGEMYILTTPSFDGSSTRDPILRILPQETGATVTCGAESVSMTTLFLIISFSVALFIAK